jgi:signal recognition particle subunit SEC65
MQIAKEMSERNWIRVSSRLAAVSLVADKFADAAEELGLIAVCRRGSVVPSSSHPESRDDEASGRDGCDPPLTQG